MRTLGRSYRIIGGVSATHRQWLPWTGQGKPCGPSTPAVPTTVSHNHSALLRSCHIIACYTTNKAKQDLECIWLMTVSSQTSGDRGHQLSRSRPDSDNHQKMNIISQSPPFGSNAGGTMWPVAHWPCRSSHPNHGVGMRPRRKCSPRRDSFFSTLQIALKNMATFPLRASEEEPAVACIRRLNPLTCREKLSVPALQRTGCRSYAGLHAASEAEPLSFPHLVVRF